MKKGLWIVAVVLVLCSCEQLVMGSKIEAEKTMYTITHGEYEGGKIEKNPYKMEYNRKESVTLKAVPDEGWEFIGWKENVESAEKIITVTVTKNIVITPVFKKNKFFTITYKDLEGGIIKIEPNKNKYEENEKVRITAIAKDGWYFQGWNNAGLGLDQSTEIIMNKDYLLSPIFTAVPKFSLVIHESEGGSLHISPLKEFYTNNETVTLTVLINEDYRFKGIIGTILTSDLSKQIIMDKNYELTPLFTKNPKFAINVDESYRESVHIDPDKTEYEENEKTELTALPIEGFTFVRWEGTVLSDKAKLELTMNRDYVQKPVYKKNETYSISIQNSGGGQVYISPQKENYEKDEQVRVTAVPDDDFLFKGWRGSVISDERIINIVMDKDYELSPVFSAVPKYSLIINESEGGSIHVDPLQEAYDHNDTVTLTVQIENDYRYKGITGTILTSDLTKQILMDRNYELTPLFTKNPKYTITFSDEYIESLHIDPDKEEYEENEKVAVTALPLEGYTFVRWEGTVLSDKAKLDLTMNRDYVQKPVYKKNETYSISIQNSGGGQVYVNPKKEKYEKDEQVTLTAVPDEDCLFNGWKGSVISREISISIVMNKNYTLESNFAPVVKYALNIINTAGGRIISAPEKENYEENAEVYITAIPDDGFVFSYWKGDITGSENPYCVRMLRDYEAEAVFESIPEIEKFTINPVQKTGSGSVVVEPQKEYYLKNETVIIRAVPDNGFMVSSLKCSSQDYSWNKKTNELTIQVHSNLVIEAEFIKREWSFLVYMAADNDLEYEAIKDFNELEGVNYAGMPVSVIILLDRNPAYDSSNGNWSGTRLYEILHDTAGVDGIIKSKELSCPELDLGSGYSINLNAANPDILEKCIEYVQSEYSAENYGLIMWGHGTGWRGGFGEGSVSKAFAVDDTENTYMTNAAFGKAIEGKEFSVIGFDTCFGGVIETAYEIKDSADLMIASESIVPANGWDYYSLFTSFLETDLSALSFCNKTVTQFENQYSGDKKCTISVINLNEIQEVKNSFDIFSLNAASLITSTEERNSMFNVIMNQPISFSHSSSPCNLYVDIYSLSKKLADAYNPLNSTAQNLQLALRNTVINSWSSFDTYGYNLGVYFCDLINGVASSTHDNSYVRGSGSAQQSKFVQESTGWVPNKINSGSLLDNLFYASF